MIRFNFNWKLLIAVGSVFVAMMICAIMMLNMSDDPFFDETEYPELLEATVDDVSYELVGEWSYDQENRVFTNAAIEDASFYIEDLANCDQKSLKDRRATFEEDDSDGITKEVIEVDGTKGLLTYEPVNEIDFYCIYFYKDNQEHCVYVECDYGNKKIKRYIDEFVDGISLGENDEE